MLEEISRISTTKKDIKSFAITIGIILCFIASFLFYKEIEYYRIFIYVAFVLIGSGLIIPNVLKPVYYIWMVFANILGWIMTRLILSLLFYLIISPIGIFSKIFGTLFPGPGTIYLEQLLKFKRPMYPNKEYYVKLIVEGINKADFTLQIKTEIFDFQSKKKTISGHAIVSNKMIINMINEI